MRDGNQQISEINGVTWSGRMCKPDELVDNDKRKRKRKDIMKKSEEEKKSQ